MDADEIKQHQEFGLALADQYSDILLDEQLTRQIDAFMIGFATHDDPRLDPALDLYRRAYAAYRWPIPVEPADWTEALVAIGSDN